MFDVTQYQFYKSLTNLDCVKRIILFGSRAGTFFRPDSDIDIAIDCPTASTHQWQQVLDIIEDADTLLKIDCVRFDTLQENSLLKRNIESEGIVLYDRSQK
ncbi:MAG: nucleotidyltransferase domain-containing protein [Proteobacteria bacterium]|nr:nucleotidyltransferase domain-containing protein [Pseudomonadota bacterium]